MTIGRATTEDYPLQSLHLLRNPVQGTSSVEQYVDKYSVLIVESAADQLFIRVTDLSDLGMRACRSGFRHRQLGLLGQEGQSGVEILCRFSTKGSRDEQGAS
jgi:hypothetical protein